MEIGRRRVRFRDGGREFGLALDDPQLRHLDHAYPDWLARAGALREEAKRHLDAAGKRSAGREEEPGIDRLRDLKAELDKALREDREKIERIENERQEQSLRQDRGRGQGFSM